MSKADTKAPDIVMDLAAQRPTAECLKSAWLDKAISITDNIYMSYGISNAYMVTSTAGRVIINTGMAYEALLTHKKLFDEVADTATKYIITTQAHPDHVGGVELFKEPETQYIAQQLVKQCQQDDERIADRRQAQAYYWFNGVIDSVVDIADEHPDVMQQDLPVPDITFDESYSFNVGETDFELIHVSGGETVDSCLVWLPQQRIVFSGNLFGPFFPHFPNFNTIRGDKYRDIESYLASARKLLALKPSMLITGHGDPIEGEELIKSCVQRLIDAVEYIHQETLKGIAENKDIYDLMAEISLPKSLSVGQGYGKVSWCVRTIWESYMGWFKARETIELYPTQHKALYADIANIAGHEGLLNLGREKLNNNPVASTMLADMVLAADETHLPALQLAIDAHKSLLQQPDAESFWVRGWLQHQIREYQAMLDDINSGRYEQSTPQQGQVEEIFSKLPQHFKPDASMGVETAIQFNISDGSCWTVAVNNGTCNVNQGKATAPACIIHMGERELIGLMTGTMGIMKVAFGGNLRVEGDKLQARILDKAFARNMVLSTNTKAVTAKMNNTKKPKNIIIDDLRNPKFTLLQKLVHLGTASFKPTFTVEKILAEATKRAGGLSDFGPDDFKDRLAIILEDYNNDYGADGKTGMNGVGRMKVYNDIIRYAANRLLIHEQFKKHPEILEEDIEAPIIVVGLPRSGTTHLLSLLESDSRFRSLPYWIAGEPVPLPNDNPNSLLNRLQYLFLKENGAAHERDPRWLRSQAQWAGLKRIVPLLASMHPLNPDHIQEDVDLWAPDFGSYVFEWIGVAPTYRDKISYGSDLTPHYEYMKNCLKLLQWKKPKKRWVIKCPQHLENLPVLQKVFPDATIVVTARDPLAVIQSATTMLAYGARMNRNEVDTERLIKYWVDRVEHLLKACVKDRPNLPETQSIDCPFHIFMQDNMAMIEAIYAKAGIEMTDTARRELQGYIDAHPRGKAGQIIYDLKGDFGVDINALKERFKFYFDAYPMVKTEVK